LELEIWTEEQQYKHYSCSLFPMLDFLLFSFTRISFLLIYITSYFSEYDYDEHSSVIKTIENFR
jgi:hypothetical protein